MTYEQLRSNIDNGAYEVKAKYVSPKKDKSVEGYEARAAYEKEDLARSTAFDTDLKAALAADGVPAQYVNKIYSKAWEHGHSAGHHEILTWAMNLAEIFDK